MNWRQRVWLIAAVAVASACGEADTPTGPPPTPAPSRADQGFLAIGYSCVFGNDADRKFSLHEIDPATGLLRSTAFSTGTNAWGSILELGPHRPNGRLLYT